MRQITNFSEANKYLAKFHNNSQTEYTLDTMLRLMDYLGNPQEKFRVVHVAGTSGKTSTAYYIAALLSASGLKTGLTVSPHVDEINQRVQVNLKPLPESEFCLALTEFLDLLEAMPIKPSWFELMIAFAYWYFAREGVDYVVVEVGLGGLKDGTNVIKRADKVCVITDIGTDHIEILGKTLAEIASQKLGIVHPGNEVFMYGQNEEIMKVAEKVCVGQNASLNIVNFNEEKLAVNENLINLPDYQQRNWLLAHKAYEFLINREKLQYLTSQVLKETQEIQIPGRMDIRKIHDKTIVMDGAHNEQKMTAFVSSFHKLYPDVKPAVLISLKAGKEYQEVVPLLSKLTSRVVTTSFDTSQDTPVQSMDPEALAAAFRKAGAVNVDVIPDQKTAVRALLNSQQKTIIITGSFYLLGQIRNNGYLE